MFSVQDGVELGVAFCFVLFLLTSNQTGKWKNVTIINIQYIANKGKKTAINADLPYTTQFQPSWFSSWIYFSVLHAKRVHGLVDPMRQVKRSCNGNTVRALHLKKH